MSVVYLSEVVARAYYALVLLERTLQTPITLEVATCHSIQGKPNNSDPESLAVSGTHSDQHWQSVVSFVEKVFNSLHLNGQPADDCDRKFV